jgi:hypothetical protein
LNTYKQQLTSVPTRMEVNGMRTGAVNGTIGMIQGYNSM